MNNNISLPQKRIMLTGGAGFLGSIENKKLKAMPVPHKRYAHQAAKARGSKDVFIPAEQEYDTTKLLAAQHLTLSALAPRAVKVIKILRTVPYAPSSPMPPSYLIPLCGSVVNLLSRSPIPDSRPPTPFFFNLSFSPSPQLL